VRSRLKCLFVSGLRGDFSSDATSTGSSSLHVTLQSATLQCMSIVGTKGGSGVWQRIISEFPRHSVYIEPFWGRGAICRAKRPADVTIGIDLDPNAISDGKDLALMFHTDGHSILVLSPAS